MSRRPALGRGLAELIPAGPAPGESVQDIAVALIDPNPFQPRTEFDPAGLAELASSIKAQGLLQPVTVRPHGQRFQLVAGERRLRAVQDLGQTTIRAIVREVDDSRLLELALVENLMRADLSEIEVAEALRELQRRHNYNAGELATALGRSRPAIANTLRLLELPKSVRDLIRRGRLSAGHGRAVLSFPEELRETAARDSIASGWSVRELERRAAQHAAAKPKLKKSSAKPSASDVPRELARRTEQQLMEHLGTKVKVEAGGKIGTVSIAFHGKDDLQRIAELLLGGASPW